MTGNAHIATVTSRAPSGSDEPTPRGILVPLVTPLHPDETVDLTSLGRLIDHLLAAGVHGLWLLGTSGEFAGLPLDQRARAVEFALSHVAGRVPVVVNVGDGSTKLALRHARHAVGCGARLLALTPPHYYPHTMDEVLAHFRAVKDAVAGAGLYVYNIPQTVKVRMSLEATVQLAVEGTAAGIKDSQNDLQWFRQLVLAIRGHGLSDRFTAFVGTRSLIDAAVAIGADGAIPAIANVAAEDCVAAYRAAVHGNLAEARAAQERALRFEALAEVARGGSANAATLAMMKELLLRRGVLSHATLIAPLRGLEPTEVAELARRVDELTAGQSSPHGRARAEHECAITVSPEGEQ